MKQMESLKSRNTSKKETKPFKKDKTTAKFVSAVRKLNLIPSFLLAIAKEVADSSMLDASRPGSTVRSRKKSKELSKATTSLNLSVKSANSHSHKLSGSKIKTWK